MNFLPIDIENIIYNYKIEMEYFDKFQKNLDIIKNINYKIKIKNNLYISKRYNIIKSTYIKYTFNINVYDELFFKNKEGIFFIIDNSRIGKVDFFQEEVF